MARLSIVIPVLGDTSALESGLVSVLEHRPDDSEVIVVLNGEYRDPYDLKDEVRFVAAPRGAGFVRSLNAGWQASRGSIIHLLGCGFEVTAGWAEKAMQHFANPRVGAVAPLLLETAEESPRIVAAGLECDSGGRRQLALRGQEPHQAALESDAPLGPIALAAFYSRAALEALEDPFTRAVGDQLMDVDLALRMRRAGYTTVLEPASRIRGDEARWPVQRPGYRQALFAERLFWRNAPSEAWSKAFITHLATVAQEARESFPSAALLRQFVGRVAGLMEISRHRRHYLKTQQICSPAIDRSPVAAHARFDGSHPSRKPRESFSSVISAPERR